MTAKRRIIIHTVLALVIIFVGAGGFLILSNSREALGRQEHESPLPLVRTTSIKSGDLDMVISGEGTVKPVTEIQLIPQVGGKVVYVSPNLVNGGTFKEGERLLAIEDDDYRIAVTLAGAGLKDAQSKFQMASQEAEAAVNEWKRLNSGTTPPPLVAKEPQLEAARANLEAQRANLEKAQLDLERTVITAPFNGRVSSESLDPGQYVSPGQSLATIYCTDAAEIIVPLESSTLNWFDAPGFTTDKNPGSPATILARIAGQKRTWKGEVARVQGRIDEQTRMVKVVIRIQKPYESKPPLAIGQFAEVRIHGKKLENAAVIPRAAVRSDNVVWAVNPDDGRLYFKTVDIARMEQNGVILRSGLKETDQVVVSPLKVVTDGMHVRHVDIFEGNAGLESGTDGRPS